MRCIAEIVRQWELQAVAPQQKSLRQFHTLSFINSNRTATDSVCGRIAAKFRICSRRTRRRRSARRCGTWTDKRTVPSRRTARRWPCSTCSYSAAATSCMSCWPWVPSETLFATDCESSRRSSTVARSTGSSHGLPTLCRSSQALLCKQPKIKKRICSGKVKTWNW